MQVSAREYTSENAADMLENARATRRKLMGVAPVKPIFKPASKKPEQAKIVVPTLVREVRPVAPIPEWTVCDIEFDEHVMAYRHAQAAVEMAKAQGLDVERVIGRRSLDEIVRGVLTLYPGVTINEVRFGGRERRVCFPRQHCMFEMMRQRPDMSYPAVGRYFGGKDHTTVLHAVRKIQAMKAKGEI